MPKPIKKRQPHQYADRFYDYLIAHKEEVLRYITVALVTGLIQFVLERAFPVSEGSSLLPLGIRFILLFYALKYWGYKEIGSGVFYTARQLMIAIMAIFSATWLGYQLIILIGGWIGAEAIVRYVGMALIEVIYFLLFQFLIFKEPKND